MPTLVENNYPDMPEVGVVSLLQKLKPFKACGPDQIPNCILMEIAREITPALLLLYKSSFKQAKLPDEWKYAYGTPILRMVTTLQCRGNYRPVSLTCVGCKMLEHMLSSILAHLNCHKILSEFQQSFGKH